MELIIAELSQRRLAIELARTREVLRLGPLTPVPTAPASVVGAMNAGGQVLPVLDVGYVLFGEPSSPAPGESAVWIAASVDETVEPVQCALYVGRVLEVARLGETELHEAAAAAADDGDAEQRKTLFARWRWGGAQQDVLLVDLPALLERVLEQLAAARRENFPSTMAVQMVPGTTVVEEGEAIGGDSDDRA